MSGMFINTPCLSIKDELTARRHEIVTALSHLIFECKGVHHAKVKIYPHDNADAYPEFFHHFILS